ncbi:MAG: GNAT family N-acetyltransferase [Candidatus Thorarchaeota archaeon]
MVLRNIAQDDPEIEQFKEQIKSYTEQIELLGFGYQLYLNDDEVVGLAAIGKEPMQLFKPVGTPLIRLFVINYDQPITILTALADDLLLLAKKRAVDFVYLDIPAKHKELTSYFQKIGFEQLANRFDMRRPLDDSIEVSNLLRYEQIKREDVNRFFDCMKEFMRGSRDVTLNLVIENFKNVPEVLLDYWYESEQAYFVYHDEELIGILDLAPEQSYIHNIGVSPAHRGKGYGTEMLRFCLKLFKDGGGKTARLGVHVDNKQAIHIYEKLGFTVAKQTQTLVWLKPA